MTSLSATGFLDGLVHIACSLPASHLLNLPTSKSSMNHYNPFWSCLRSLGWFSWDNEIGNACRHIDTIELLPKTYSSNCRTHFTHLFCPEVLASSSHLAAPRAADPLCFFRAIGPMHFHLHPWLPDGSPYLLSGFSYNCSFLINPIPSGHM